MPGNHKLWTLTYKWIAEQAIVSIAHARNSAWRQEFECRNIESVLQWVNARRYAKGLPPIGAPSTPATITPAPTENSQENFRPTSATQSPSIPAGGSAIQKPRKNRLKTPISDSHLLSVQQPYLMPPAPTPCARTPAPASTPSATGPAYSAPYNPLTGSFEPTDA